MRLSPTSTSFGLGLAVGAVAVLVIGFVDLWIRPNLGAESTARWPPPRP
jgi:hypothetical protein